MNIRQATAADIPPLTMLVNNSYRGETSKKGWTTEAGLLDGVRTNEESLKEMLHHPKAVMLLAEETKKLCGCVYLEQQGDALYLGMLTVYPELQGKGLGAKLLQAAASHAKNLQVRKIRMTVITARSELIAYYERKGYRDTGKRKPFEVGVQFGTPKKNL